MYYTQKDVFTNSVNKDEYIKGFKLPGRKENLKLSNTRMIPVSYPLTFLIYLLSLNNFQNIIKLQDLH